ncbi:MAG: LLM class flavin-dependent oxidoreductase [Acidobacteriota bacterium]|nr:LLM class flavin-dependent oxidoreductase [Acidobacteriota bacterium]
MIPLSVLDLVPVNEGSTPREALGRSLDLAQHAERLGFRRFWVAEHHNMPSIASAATAVVIGYLAGGTSTIRIGAGGIMLPNHSPLVIAEQFGTLESLYPGRIDLGLGRAPGTDDKAMRALRRSPEDAAHFPHDVQELQALLAPVQEGQRIQAVPGGGLQVPLWILGSSTFGAQLAAMLGLPYAFASHFAPDALGAALAIYRARFAPSVQLARPCAMPTINVIAAATDAEARRLFTTVQMAFANIGRGRPALIRPPIDDIETFWSQEEKARATHMLTYSVVGGPGAVRDGLARLVDATGADELMIVTTIHDHAARLRSYEIVAEAAAR